MVSLIVESGNIGMATGGGLSGVIGTLLHAPGVVLDLVIPAIGAIPGLGGLAGAIPGIVGLIYNFTIDLLLNISGIAVGFG